MCTNCQPLNLSNDKHAWYIYYTNISIDHISAYLYIEQPVYIIYKQLHYCDTFIYLFGVLRRFQHCTGHITTGSWKGRGNQYIEFARVVYCKLPTNGKQLPAFPLKAITGIELRPQRWEARVLPLCHRGPYYCDTIKSQNITAPIN